MSKRVSPSNAAPEPLQLSRVTARRFVLGKQGLWPGRRWAGKAGTHAAITACEHLQLDPLVILARSHDLMLHSRVIDYRPELFDALAYDERAFFDWGGWLAVRPMHELPFWRVLMRRDKAHYRLRQTAKQHRAAIEEMRGLLRERGTVSGREFKASERKAVTSYRGRKDSSVALYYLWRIGEAMTHHRDGFERVYASTESVAPKHLLTDVSDAETDRFIARKGIAFAGIGRVGPLSRSLARRVGKEEERGIERDLIERGEIVGVEVDGWRGTHFVLASDLADLDAVARGSIPRAWAPVDTDTTNEVAFLSPLDPVSARGRAKLLFDFDYVWEIYKRPEHVKFGRYTLPMLFGDELVGRIDLRADRKTKSLVVNGVWLERRDTAQRTEFCDALSAGVRRMMRFLDCERVNASAIKNRRLRMALAALDSGQRKRRVRRLRGAAMY